MYIVWVDFSGDGWQRHNAETLEDALRLREQHLSRGEGDVVLTEVVDNEGLSGMDAEIKCLSMLKRELGKVDTASAVRIADWALAFARKRTIEDTKTLSSS